MIDIDWLRKELYEMLYRREIGHEVLMVFIKLIHKWSMEKEGEK